MKTFIEKFKREWDISIILFLILLTGYAYIFPRWADWNQNSRLNLVMAIVDKGTLSIDDYHENTEDKFNLKGHYYSTKAPGSAFLGVPVYWLFRQFTGSSLINRLTDFPTSNQAATETLREGGTGISAEKLYVAFALYVVTLWVVSIPSALLGVVIYHFLGHFTNSQGYRIWLTLVYGLATSAFPYAGSYYGHQIVAVFLFFAFYLLFREGYRQSTRPTVLLLVGFLMAYATITEYPAALIAGGLFFYALYKLPKKTAIVPLIVGGIPPIILWMIYNYSVFGKPIAFGYSVKNAFSENQVGLFSLTYPHWEALWGITFGSYRGLFFLAPVLLLAIPGFYYFFQRHDLRAEFLMCLYAVVTFLLFNGSSVMWSGGFAVGPRYLVLMLPFLAVPLIFFTNIWGDVAWMKWLIAFLTTWSVSFIWIETLSGQNFPDYTRNPLINYSLPKLMAGDIARNIGTILGLSGWFSLLPLLMLFILLFGFLFKQFMQMSIGQGPELPHKSQMLVTGDRG